MKKTAKNSIIYLVGSIAHGLIGLISTMLLTRMVPDKVYAMYGLFGSFASASITMISLGFDSAYSRFYYAHGYTQKRFLAKILFIPMIIFGAFTLVVIEPNRFLLNYVFGEDISAIAVIFLILYIFVGFIHKFSQLTARMEEHAGNYIASTLIGKSGFVAIIALVLLIFKDVTFDWVLISFFISASIGTLINVYVFAKVANNRIEDKGDITTRELFNYGFPYMINNVLILIIPLIEKLIIRDLTSWETLSIFTAASIFQSVTLVLTNTLINIWNPLVFKHCETEDKNSFKPVIHNFGFAATIIVMFGLAACILLRRWLVLLLDSSYHSVYIIAPSVMFGAMFHILTIIYSVGINISKKTYHFIISPIIQLSISIALCFLLIGKMDLGLIGIAIASLASLVISKTYRIAMGLHYFDSGKSEWKTVLLCITAVAASVFTMFFTNIISDVIVFIVLVALTLAVANREIVPLTKMLVSLIKPSIKKKN